MDKNTAGALPAWTTKCRAIFLLLISFSFLLKLSAQSPVHVGGTVKDSKGNPVAGVTVAVKGSTIGTTTDANGTFTINVPSPQSVLTFSYVGYLTKEQIVGNQQLIDITLADKQNDLDEVVVIGYGQTQKKRDVGGAISSVNS